MAQPRFGDLCKGSIMDLMKMLGGVELFNQLTDQELEQVAQIFMEKRLKIGDVLTKQGSRGDELFLVTEGFVEVMIEEGVDRDARKVVNLGRGQIIGEMSLVDEGPRSATVRAISDPTVVQVARRQAFESLCETNTRIGYRVMRNIAADLSFKLRHQHLDR